MEEFINGYEGKVAAKVNDEAHFLAGADTSIDQTVLIVLNDQKGLMID